MQIAFTDSHCHLTMSDASANLARAREQVPLAPFGLGSDRGQRREAPLQHVAFGLQREQGKVDLAAFEAEWRGDRLRRRRTDAAQAGAQQLAERLLARREAFCAFGRRCDDRVEKRIGIETAHGRQSLRGDPQVDLGAVAGDDSQARRACRRRQLVEPAAPTVVLY